MTATSANGRVLLATGRHTQSAINKIQTTVNTVTNWTKRKLNEVSHSSLIRYSYQQNIVPHEVSGNGSERQSWWKVHENE